jgi:hypothetical protein
LGLRRFFERAISVKEEGEVKGEREEEGFEGVEILSSTMGGMIGMCYEWSLEEG